MGDHIRHVQLGEAADLLLIAPATANTMAKLAQGLADNLLLVTALAARCPVVIAPAMDGAMFESAATQSNLDTLLERGVRVIGPASGRMASGLEGMGRMVEPDELLGQVRMMLGQTGILRGKQIVVTAGPTQEPLDPVRFLTNRSSGKQGFAIAQAALDSGAYVTLISGPVHIPLPVGVNHIPVRTAVEMRDSVLKHVQQADALLMAAAVADYRPQNLSVQKIKKAGMDNPVIALSRNPDILSEVDAQKAETGRPLVTLGFAAETERLLEHGTDKLKRKGLDFIAINDVSRLDAGFAADTNAVVLMDSKGQMIDVPHQSKTLVAEFLIEIVAEKLLDMDR
jgi:phosphopantothenoylcysteine decarboxylase/phosphopantothenate--cysteine ligase